MPHTKNKKLTPEEELVEATAPKKTKPRRSVDEYSEVMRNEPVCDNHFAAYMPKPSKLLLDVLEQHEQIILVLRQHPITQLKYLLVVIFMVFLPLLFSSANIFNFLPATYQFAAGLGWYLLTFGFIVETFLNWFYHVYIITDERIIDVDFLSMIYKDISTTKIDKIEDITSLNAGFLGSLVDYGTLIIQTSATKQELLFEDTPHPSRVAKLLNDLILEEELEKYEGRVS